MLLDDIVGMMMVMVTKNAHVNILGLDFLNIGRTSFRFAGTNPGRTKIF